MKKMSITLIFSIAILLCGCSTDNNKVDKDNNSYNHADTFVRLDVPEHNIDLTEDEIAEKYNEYGDMSWYSDGTIEDTTEETSEIENWNEQYKDKYESNIEIDEDIDVDLSTYTWYIPIENSEFEYNIGTHQWIAYGINKYYNKDVQGTFTCEIPNDIIESETNMIFTVRVHGDINDLDVFLDTYNEKIIVTEVN